METDLEMVNVKSEIKNETENQSEEPGETFEFVDIKTESVEDDPDENGVLHLSDDEIEESIGDEGSAIHKILVPNHDDTSEANETDSVTTENGAQKLPLVELEHLMSKTCNPCISDTPNGYSELNTNKKAEEKSEKTYECPVCHKYFPFIRNLNCHMTVHSVYACKTCGKTFTRKGFYEEHCLLHSDDRPYECSVCNRGFKCKSTLARHSRLHTSNHPHHCPVCNKAFTTRQHLNRHIQTHTGEKPHKCPICSTAFSQISSLTRHQFIHSGERPHICDICKKSFSFTTDLRVHMRIHTGEKPYSCPVCCKAFTQKGNLIIHMKVHKSKRGKKLSN